MGLMNISFLMTLFQESLLNALQEILDDLVKLLLRFMVGNVGVILLGRSQDDPVVWTLVYSVTQ
jgi:hypothetical protein